MLPYRLGLIGRGPFLASLARLFRTPEYRELFAEVAPVGAAFPEEAGAAAAPPPGMPDDLPFYSGWRAMLDAQPDMNVLLETSGAPGLAETLRTVRSGLTVMDQTACRFFLDIMTSEKLCASCSHELGRTRAMLQTVLEQVREDIALLDAEGRVMDLNASAARGRGRRKQDLLGRLCWESQQLGGEGYCEPPGGRGVFREALASGRTAEGLESDVDADGHMVYRRVYAYPILNDEGGVEHVLQIRRDVTRQTFMEKRLQRSEKLAAIGELSTYIAHEIRNPLFAIGGFANQLLRSEKLDEPSREKIKIILEESRRLDNILKSILNFARPANPERNGEGPARTEVNEAVMQTMNLMSIGCEKQGVEVSIDLAPEVAKARLDPEVFKQCLINVVKNAIEAMPEGGRLGVSTAMRDHMIEVQVTDTGAGVAPEVMDKIFSPFFSTKDKGSGLGLAMIKKILDEAGGDVELANRPASQGGGVRATLRLPPVMAVEAVNAGETEDAVDAATGHDEIRSEEVPSRETPA